VAKKFLVLLALVSAQAFAASGPRNPFAGLLAHREPGVSYLNYMMQAAVLPQAAAPPLTTPVDESKTFEQATLPAATAWESKELMLQRFQEMRDLRFMQLDSKPNFPRRISWLYPDDGCFARAQVAVRNLIRSSYAAPSKVFVFGDLNVSTVNSPYGTVNWWYHVAPIVEVDGEKFVLDPAIEPSRPLPLAEWLGKMNPEPGKLSVAICQSGSYHPYDDCARVNDGDEAQAQSEQEWFLDSEWSRLVELNRDPEKELGDSPPWL
jgi:hypothetical protein